MKTGENNTTFFHLIFILYIVRDILGKSGKSGPMTGGHGVAGSNPASPNKKELCLLVKFLFI